MKKTELLGLLFVALGGCADKPAISAPVAPAGSGESKVDVQRFYQPFTPGDITAENMQQWPYYKYVSTKWDAYALHGTKKIAPSKNPVALQKGEPLDLNGVFRPGQTFIQSLLATQTKAFIVIKDNRILAEFYDNGFNVGDVNLLQSATKTITGVIIHRLIDAGQLEPDVRVETYLGEFKGASIGAATVQQVLDMTSGLPPLTDFHTPGTPGQLFEVEIGLQLGTPVGHVTAIKSAVAVAAPGTAWAYTDINANVLGLLAERVSGRTFPQLAATLFDDIGAKDSGSVATTSEGDSATCYGVSMSARDFVLFHQWIAQRKAPKSYYTSASDGGKTKIGKTPFSHLGEGLSYGSMTYYLAEPDVLFSMGSYGQVGFSDMKTGVAVVSFSDWSMNTDLKKWQATRDRALKIIEMLRQSRE